MREKIQQISRETKPGQKASVGVFPFTESTDFARIPDNDTPKKNCPDETAGSRGAVRITIAKSGFAKKIFRCLTPSGILILFVRIYQKMISPWFPPCCRFQPTCSAYAREALSKHGFLKGLALSVWRIARCHPFCKGGYDPVPPAKADNVSRIHNIKGV